METDSELTFRKINKSGGCEVIGIDEGNNLLALKESLIWIHLDYNNPEAIKWLQSTVSIDNIVVESILSEDSRPRSTQVGDGLLMGLRGVNQNPGEAPEDMIAIRLWVEEHLILSSNRRKLKSLEDIRSSLLNMTGPRSSSEFIAFLVDRLAENSEGVIEQLEENLESIEENIARSNSAELRTQLAALRRLAIHLKRYLAPQKEALSHLLIEYPPWLHKRERLLVKESMNKYSRYLEELASVHDRALVVQEELISHLSEMMNKRMFTLSVVATLFLPLSFFTGLLGINVGGIPGADSPYGFVFFCVIIVLFVFLQIIYLKVKKWF